MCASRYQPVWLAGALACIFGAILIQVGTNFANDLFDFRKGADNTDRLGPPRAVQEGWLTEREVWAGTWIAFAFAFLVGMYLVFYVGPVIVAIGLLSITAGLAYTAGPFPLAYNGLGDVFVFVFFGLVAVCGTAYVQLTRLPELVWWVAVPVGTLATAILVVNNLRDLEGDREANKRTLAVRFGARFTRIQYAVLLGAGLCDSAGACFCAAWWGSLCFFRTCSCQELLPFR